MSEVPLKAAPACLADAAKLVSAAPEVSVHVGAIDWALEPLAWWISQPGKGSEEFACFVTSSTVLTDFILKVFIVRTAFVKLESKPAGACSRRSPAATRPTGVPRS